MQSMKLLVGLVGQDANNPNYLNEFASATNSLANVLRGRGENPREIYEDAILLMEDLHCSLPDVPLYEEHLAAARRNLALVLIESGQCGDARESLLLARDACISLNGRYPGNYDYTFQRAATNTTLARALVDLDDNVLAKQVLGEAIDWFSQLVTAVPDDPAYQDGLAKAHRDLGRLLHKMEDHAGAQVQYDAAIDIFTQALKLDPSDSHARSAVAWTCVYLAQLTTADEAKTAYEQALEHWQRLPSESMSRLFGLAWLRANCRHPSVHDPNSAIEHAELAVSLAPKSAKYRNLLGAAYYRAGEWEKSICELKKIIEASADRDSGAELRTVPDSMDYFYLAMACWQSGDQMQEAKQYYDRANELLKQNRPGNFERIQLRDEARQLLHPILSAADSDSGRNDASDGKREP